MKLTDTTQTAREIPAEVKNCGFIKTILMILVVLYHSILYWKGTWVVGMPALEAKPLAFAAELMNSFHIYGFTLVSGYLFCYLKYEQRRYQEFLPFMCNKARRLLVPYAFASLVWAAPIAAHYFDFSAQVIFRRYFLGEAPGQLWFLLMLFWVFAVFWPLSDFFHERTMQGAFLVLCFYGAGIVCGKITPDVFRYQDGLMYLPVFWVGFKMRQYGFRKLQKLPGICWILLHIFMTLFTDSIPADRSLVWKLLQVGSRFVTQILGAVMIFLVLQEAAGKIRWDTKLFRAMSRNSMAVYLFHQQIVYFFDYRLNGLLNPYLHAGINFVAAMGISLCISSVLMRSKFTRFLIGEKH